MTHPSMQRFMAKLTNLKRHWQAQLTRHAVSCNLVVLHINHTFLARVTPYNWAQPHLVLELHASGWVISARIQHRAEQQIPSLISNLCL